MKAHFDVLDVLKGYAETVSPEISAHIPRELLSSVMIANNRALAAAIVENGGELRISPDAVRVSLTTKTHIIATVGKEGALKLSFAPKDEIVNAPLRALPL
jgi:hypothetical protein